jgi:hypothetical protein
MPSSDIYNVKESPWANQEKTPAVSQRRRRRKESFDEAIEKDLSKTHRRRRKNSGFRRFRHLMKKPDFSKKFWITALSIGGAILLAILIWDWFFRYPKPEPEPDPGPAYEMEIEVE